jgi:hypothetical protein
MSDRPTPAEAMALWYSLERPSGAEVAARFTAAGRPICSRTITRWKKQGWPGVANAPRTDRPTPAQAQAIWDSLDQPSLHKVADAFKAQGRPVSPATIWNWQQAGWSDVTAQNAAAKANRAVEKIAAALPALTGDATSTLSDFLSGSDAVPDERRSDAHNDDQRRIDVRSKAEVTEDTLREAMQTARVVNAAIRKVAAAVARTDASVSADAPLPMLLRQPDGIAKLMMASNAGISVTIAGMRQLPAMRAEEEAEVPGTQTVYPPGEDDPQNGGDLSPAAWEKIWEEIREGWGLLKQAEAARAIGDTATVTQVLRRFDERCEADKARPCRNGDFLRSSIEAIDEELRAIILGKYDKR